MHTLSIKLDDSIYEHFKEFLRFYPKNKLSIIEDSDDIVFTDSNEQAYKEGLQDLQDGKSINWKDYAKTKNIDV